MNDVAVQRQRSVGVEEVLDEALWRRRLSGSVLDRDDELNETPHRRVGLFALLLTLGEEEEGKIIREVPAVVQGLQIGFRGLRLGPRRKTTETKVHELPSELLVVLVGTGELLHELTIDFVS